MLVDITAVLPDPTGTPSQAPTANPTKAPTPPPTFAENACGAGYTLDHAGYWKHQMDNSFTNTIPGCKVRCDTKSNCIGFSWIPSPRAPTKNPTKTPTKRGVLGNGVQGPNHKQSSHLVLNGYWPNGWLSSSTHSPDCISCQFLSCLVFSPLLFSFIFIPIQVRRLHLAKHSKRKTATRSQFRVPALLVSMANTNGPLQPCQMVVSPLLVTFASTETVRRAFSSNGLIPVIMGGVSNMRWVAGNLS